MAKISAEAKKSLSFSKKIFIFIAIITTIVIVYTMVATWYVQDLSALTVLIPALIAELGVGTGFYYVKAARENSKGGITYDSAMKKFIDNERNDDDNWEK